MSAYNQQQPSLNPPSAEDILDLTLPDNTLVALDHRKRRRNRTTQSCLNCHTSKRKCDRKRPCQRCTQLGLTGICVYEVDDLSLRDDSNLDEPTRLRNRIAELERLVRELRGKPHPRWADPNFRDGDRIEKWHSRASKLGLPPSHTKRHSHANVIDTPNNNDDSSTLIDVVYDDTSFPSSLVLSPIKTEPVSTVEHTKLFHANNGHDHQELSALYQFNSPPSSPPLRYSTDTGTTPSNGYQVQTGYDVNSSLSNATTAYAATHSPTDKRYTTGYFDQRQQQQHQIHSTLNCQCLSSTTGAYLGLSHQLKNTLLVLDHLIPSSHAHASRCAVYERVRELDGLLNGMIDEGSDSSGHSYTENLSVVSHTPPESELMTPVITSSLGAMSGAHPISPVNAGGGGVSPAEWESMGYTTTTTTNSNPYFSETLASQHRHHHHHHQHHQHVYTTHGGMGYSPRSS